MQNNFQPRNKRTPVPMTRPEFVVLRNYAVRKKLPMSRVLLHLIEGPLSAIQRGDDPLSDLGADT